MIIPTCNRNNLLARCLDRIAPGRQTLPADLYEVIVSDDSKEGVAEPLINKDYPWVRYTHGHARGPAVNRNNGARLAAGRWLVFTDDDCLPDTNWLNAYAQAIEANPEVRAFEGAILPDDWELLKKDMAECPVNTEGGCFWSANIMIQKALFERVGGFNEGFRLPANEDQMIMKLLVDHTAIYFAPEAIITHGVRIIPLLEKIRKSKAMARSWIYMMVLNKKSLGEIMLKALTNSFVFVITSIRYGRAKSLTFHLYNLIVIFPQIPFLFSKEISLNHSRL